MIYEPGEIIYFKEDFDYKFALNDEKSIIKSNKPHIVKETFGKKSMTILDPDTELTYFIYEKAPDGTRDGGLGKITTKSEIRDKKINQLIR